jgi:hypothetical protein
MLEAQGRMGKHRRFWWTSQEERDQYENLGADDEVIEANKTVSYRT